MTVKQLHKLTDNGTRIYVSIGEHCKQIDRENPVEMAVYGACTVKRLFGLDADAIEAKIETHNGREA